MHQSVAQLGKYGPERMHRDPDIERMLLTILVTDSAFGPESSIFKCQASVECGGMGIFFLLLLTTIFCSTRVLESRPPRILL